MIEKKIRTFQLAKAMDNKQGVFKGFIYSRLIEDNRNDITLLEIKHIKDKLKISLQKQVERYKKKKYYPCSDKIFDNSKCIIIR